MDASLRDRRILVTRAASRIGAAALDAMVASVVRTLGGLDVLVHVAGLWRPRIPGRIGVAEIDYLVDTNLMATIPTNHAAHAATRGTGGRIINFGSDEAVMGSPISAVYAATKGPCRRGHAPRLRRGGRPGHGERARSGGRHSGRGPAAVVSRTRGGRTRRSQDEVDNSAGRRAR